MSVQELESDLLHFRLGKAAERVEDYFTGTLLPEIAAIAKKAATDEWKMMAASVKAHIGDLSITSPVDSFVKVAKEVLADIIVQAPTILISDIFVEINAVVSAQVS